MANTVDPRREHFPMCVVWSPIPLLTWLIPFVGHTGVVTNEGVIHDFAGPFYINRSRDRTGFGRVTKYWMLDPMAVRSRGAARTELEAWDTAVVQSSEAFEKTIHNLVCNNCHHHASDVLNRVEYDGRSNWGCVTLVLALALHSHYVSWGRLAQTWLPFLFIVAIVAVIVATTSAIL
eukprot:m51a1_g813 hypothetical protein (177) ;mRNA; f:685027-685770